jgi:hypothetical protein
MDDLELALDKCLQQLAAGKWSLGQCLAKYPQYATELRPLLETALQLQRGKTIRPSGTTRDRTRAELASYMEAHPRGGKASRGPKLGTKVGVLLIVVILALAITSAAFAQNALPGQALYALKLTTERAWRAVAGDPIKADLILESRRADELIQLAKNQSSHPSNAALGVNAETAGIAAYTDVLNRLDQESNSENGEQILSELQEHQTAFAQAGIHVPRLDDILLRAQMQKDRGKGQGKEPPKKP